LNEAAGDFDRKGQQMRTKRITTAIDHSQVTPGWHDLQSCAICLEAFLPQAYERRAKETKEAKARGEILAPLDIVKIKARGIPFPKKTV